MAVLNPEAPEFPVILLGTVAHILPPVLPPLEPLPPVPPPPKPKPVEKVPEGMDLATLLNRAPSGIVPPFPTEL